WSSVWRKLMLRPARAYFKSSEKRLHLQEWQIWAPARPPSQFRAIFQRDKIATGRVQKLSKLLHLIELHASDATNRRPGTGDSHRHRADLYFHRRTGGIAHFGAGQSRRAKRGHYPQRDVRSDRCRLSGAAAYFGRTSAHGQRVPLLRGADQRQSQALAGRAG